MGYALFANRKLVLDSQLNSLQLQQQQRSNTQYCLATDQTGLQQQLSSLQTAQSTELADLYGKLAQTTDTNQRASINSAIDQKKAEFQTEIDAINRAIYEVSIKENAVEMEVKHLDTQVTAMQKQLEAVEQAEGQGIDRATPHYSGLG